MAPGGEDDQPSNQAIANGLHQKSGPQKKKLVMDDSEYEEEPWYMRLLCIWSIIVYVLIGHFYEFMTRIGLRENKYHLTEKGNEVSYVT